MKPLLIAHYNLKSFQKRKAVFYEADHSIKLKQAIDTEQIRNIYFIEKGIAHIPVKGELIYDDQWFAYWINGSVTTQLKANIEEALAEKSIESIVLQIDSPGGEADGIAELSDLIYFNRNKKPIIAEVKNTCASAAYWIASACERIISDQYAFLGSVGAFISFYEDQELVTLVSDISPLKTDNKENDYSNLKRIVNETGTQFVDSVARNRGVSRKHVLNNFGKGSVLTAKEIFLVKGIDSIKGHEYDLNHEQKGDHTMKTLQKMKKKASLVIIDDETVELPETVEAMPVDEITADWVKENLPDVAQELLAEGSAGGEEMASPPEEMQGQEATALANTKKILSIDCFTDQERKLQKQAIMKGDTEARFLADLTSVRVQKAGSLIRNIEEDSKLLDGTLPGKEEDAEKVSLINTAKQSMKGSLLKGGRA